ncbi:MULTISPECIES: DUF5076 domain-containing protein [unclassified Lentimonas]|uniref:DUF5076 domain-containing protein n=1 Tax=unclassified Lentimonas TaxID=2630993 RepID=UPI001321997B|nr:MULTISPECIES: DUF5076 domain-containing protein [unclassified Lentimonas]CAA6680158.1 Unannotated [Lentimonas sp. CC4]CAA6687469.1 Unannotated [Lentimonas sp. CC6]CAA7076202.1 Unannotated [Lentimonas sp. CC4]CAA7172127.1 Unannotated [Lentimonas sp. CC21]CAA7181798.1 Unannotated [Lentimonas sp. CC8]
MRKLPIPPDCHSADQAIELISGWIVDQKLQCSLYPSVFEKNPENWGVLLADAARHISRALEEEAGMDKDEVLSMIWKKMNESWNDPWEEFDGDHVEWPTTDDEA